MRPTALGVKAFLFYVLLVVAFFAAPYANHFFLLLSFLTIMGLLNLAWGLLNRHRLAGHVDEIEAGPAGSRLPVGYESGGHAVRLELDVHGMGTLRIDSRLPALERGVYRIKVARLVSTWPLGLIAMRRTVTGPEEIIVYPVPALAAEAVGGPGEDGVAPTEGMLQPSGLREFRAGDDVRRVHWRASARRGDLVVAEWDGGHGRGSEVVLDRRCDEEPLERALAVACAMALAARDDKEALTFHSQGVSSTFGSEHRPWSELFRILAAAKSLSADAPAPPAVAPTVMRLP